MISKIVKLRETGQSAGYQALGGGRNEEILAKGSKLPGIIFKNSGDVMYSLVIVANDNILCN